MDHVASLSRPRRRVVAAFLLSAVLVGCGGPPSTSPTPGSSAAAVSERTEWERELADLDADGSRSLESSLQLFAMAFGPLPGVEAPEDAGAIISGSPAIRAIRARSDELTGEQRSAVDAYLEVPSDAVRIDVPETAAAAPRLASLSGGPPIGARAMTVATGGSVAAADQTFVNQVAGVVADGRSALTRKWTDFPGGLPIFISDESYPALSWYEATGGIADFQCRIMISGDGVAAGIQTLRFSLYHELFHCAQAWRANLDVGGIPPWVWEGGARYFAHDTIGFDGDPAWIGYMTKPDTVLFSRGYDAIGFWGHLRYARGGDVYLSMEAALADGSNEQRFAVVGADDASFLPRLRDVDRFDAWLDRIIRNGCRDALRRRRRSREIYLDEAASLSSSQGRPPVRGPGGAWPGAAADRWVTQIGTQTTAADRAELQASSARSGSSPRPRDPRGQLRARLSAHSTVRRTRTSTRSPGSAWRRASERIPHQEGGAANARTLRLMPTWPVDSGSNRSRPRG